MVTLWQVLVEECVAICEEQHWQRHQSHSCVHGMNHPPVAFRGCDWTNVLFQDHVECELVSDG
jgi:hypothetical protein